MTISKRIVVKGNELIEASYYLTVAEQRLILLAIVWARETGRGLNANSLLEIHASEYIERFGVERQTAYQALKEACDQLFDREFIFTDIDPSTQKTRHNRGRWVDLASYVPEAGKVQLNFSSKIIPLITRLSENYTTYELEQVASLTSVYAIRLYEMLIKWKSALRTPVIEIADFRSQIGLDPDQYQAMSDFKKRVLDSAVDQVNKHTDIFAEYEQVKEGKKIIGFKFKFKYKTIEAKNRESSNNQPIPLSEKQIKMFANKLANDGIFGSNYAHSNESFADLEKRLQIELTDPELVEKYLTDMQRMGYKKSNIKS